MGSSFVYECHDKNGTEIVPGMFAEFPHVTTQKTFTGFGHEKTEILTKRINSVTFYANGTVRVKAGQYNVDPSNVSVIGMNQVESMVAGIISASGGKVAQGKLAEYSEQLAELIRMHIALERSDDEPLVFLGSDAIIEDTDGEVVV